MYPEHDKLLAISAKSHAIYQFLSWLEEKDVVVADYTDFDYRIVPADSPKMKDWLAEFFEIDLGQIEAEKRAMLTRIHGESNDG